MNKTMKLNLGCGSRVVDGWVNVDYALGARLMKFPLFAAVNRHVRFFDMDWDHRVFIHDLRRRFPWGDGLVDAIYSSHTLEHLSKSDGRQFLAECFRVLKPGGLIRIIVPDLAALVSAYNASKLMADDFLIKLEVLNKDSGSSMRKIVNALVSHPHRCMYDTKRLLSILNDIGFDAASSQPFESAIEDIRSIESADRTLDAVIVEGRKPL